MVMLMTRINNLSFCLFYLIIIIIICSSSPDSPFSIKQNKFTDSTGPVGSPAENRRKRANGRFSAGSIESYFTKMLNSTPAVKKNYVFKATGPTEKAAEEDGHSVAQGPQQNISSVEEDQPIRQLSESETINASPRTEITSMTEKCPHERQHPGHKDLEKVVSSPRRANVEPSGSDPGVKTEAGDDRLCFTPELFDDDDDEEEVVEEKNEGLIHNYDSASTSFETPNTVLVEEPCPPNAHKPGDATTSRFKAEAGVGPEWWGITENSQNNKSAIEEAGRKVGIEGTMREEKGKENQLAGSQSKGVSCNPFT